MSASKRAVAVAIVLMGLLLASAHISEGGAAKCSKNAFAPLKSCLPAITGDKPKWPSAACCNAVRKVNLDCLCQAFPSTKPLPPPTFKPNPKAIVALPKICKRSIPKKFKCRGMKF